MGARFDVLSGENIGIGSGGRTPVEWSNEKASNGFCSKWILFTEQAVTVDFLHIGFCSSRSIRRKISRMES